MKRVVVFGAFGLFALFGACGEDDRPFKRPKKPDPNDAGMPGEGGEGQGGSAARGGASGFAGSSAGRAGGAGRGPGGAGGVGGRGPSGGRGGIGGGGVAGFGGGKGGFAGTGGSVPCGFYDCARLPHVRAGAPVECVNGVCVIPPGSCEENYAHCSTNTNVGCEADLRSSFTCASCTTRCSGSTPICSDDGTGYRCGTGCTEQSPDRCGGICTDVDDDAENCGECFRSCTNQGVEAACEEGECVAVGPCQLPLGDCDGMFGCETEVVTPENCGACGRNNCGATNATPDCSSASACTNPTCNPGFGNCERTSLDCESQFGAACFPRYAGTRRVAVVPEAAAVGIDGSYALGGLFSYEFDFDASLAVDRKTSAGESDAYVTRFDANGTYAWTRVVASGFNSDQVQSLAMATDGSPVAVGTFYGTADLDPGPAVDERGGPYFTNIFVSKLSPVGTLTWARTLNGEVRPLQVAVDSAGAVYVAGWFYGEVDFDPGDGEAFESPGSYGTEAGFLLKLDASGNYVSSKFLKGPNVARFVGVSVAPDDTAWALGVHSSFGEATIDGTAIVDDQGTVLAPFASTGALRGIYSLGGDANGYAEGRIAAAAGAVHVSSPFTSGDLDPGPGTVSRFTNVPSMVHVTLDSAGAYRDAHLIPSYAYDFPEIAPAAAGGALVGLRGSGLGELRSYYADGASAWTLKIGGYFSLYRLASSSTYFIVAGAEYNAADYDPGPGVDAVYGPTPVVTRYGF